MAGIAGRLPAADRQVADFGDRGQGFAAETKGAYAKQIVRSADLARGMTGDGERQFLGRDAAAIVADANQIGPALPQGYVDPRAPRIDAVFQQLLDDAGRPLNDFARGNLIDDAQWKLANRGHWSILGSQRL